MRGHYPPLPPMSANKSRTVQNLDLVISNYANYQQSILCPYCSLKTMTDDCTCTKIFSNLSWADLKSMFTCVT